MANNKNNSRNPKEDARFDKGKTASKGRRKSNFKRQRREDVDIPKSNNVTLGNMSVETPVGASRSLVFPTDSASMQSFGNYVNTPGQENFIEDFNRGFRNVVVSSSAPAVDVTFGALTKRSCNVMVIDLLHYFGSVMPLNASALTSPLDMAALNLKQYIDTSFGTNTNYDPQDLMLYLMAVSAVFPYIAEIKRDLRLALTFQENHYPQFVPRGLFAAMKISTNQTSVWRNGEGANYTAQELRSYVDRLNQLIIAFNRLPMPPEILTFGYNDEFFDNIYMDSEDFQTAQLYVFKNRGVWMYDESSGETPQLTLFGNSTTQAQSVGMKIDTLANMIDKISALRTSSTAMLQNLYNAYGSRDTVQVPTLDMTTLTGLDFVYDPNILIAIENMTIADYSNVDVTPITTNTESGRIEGTVFLSDIANGYQLAVNVPLQFHKPWDQISHDDIGWAMRLRPMFMNYTSFTNASGQTQAAPTANAFTGFAIVRACYIYSLQDNASPYMLYTMRCQREGGYDHYSSREWVEVVRDFKAAPIDIYCEWGEVTEPNHMNLFVRSYTAARDVEVTYRLEDLAMFWTYLTVTMWAGNVNRNASGTRNKTL